jgi:hypothetical protein
MDDYDRDGVSGDQDLKQEELWEIVNFFFLDKGLVQQQLRSYDTFVNLQIDQIITDVGEIELRSKELKSTALLGFDEERCDHPVRAGAGDQADVPGGVPAEGDRREHDDVPAHGAASPADVCDLDLFADHGDDLSLARGRTRD